MLHLSFFFERSIFLFELKKKIGIDGIWKK